MRFSMNSRSRRWGWAASWQWPGQCQPARLIVLRYQGDPENDSTVALVGKGITFDTGGYDIKDDESMSTMKSDMGGRGQL